MSDQPPSDSARTSYTAELIESIYRIALEPQTYDVFMGRWDDFIQDQITRLSDLQADTAADGPIGDPEIENHFGIAMRLLEQAGRPDQNLADPGHRTRLPQMLFTQDGRLVWHNGAAGAAFDLHSGLTLDDFALSDAHRAQLDDLLSGCSTTRVVLVRMARGGPKGARSPIAMSFQLSSASAEERLFMASEVRQRWPEATGTLLASGFGLSAAEIDICAALADGRTTADIARSRQSALGTVRTQIKKILQKTGSGTQVDLVSLLHATMRLAEADAPRHKSPTRVPDALLNIKLDGHTMPVETFGDPDGLPVVFFHGLLDGNAMPAEMRRLLTRNRIRLICPVRPHFGTAAPDPHATIAAAPDRFAAAVEKMLDDLRLERALLMGHLAGALYAFAAAARLGDRAAGVLNVAGGVPILSPAQFASMSVRQRVVALTARYTPRALPFVIRAGINQLDNRGEMQFLTSLYENAPQDLHDIADPELRELILAGFRFTTQQGHRAFEIDSYHMVRDWSATVAASDAPVALLHGSHDQVVSLSSVESFAAGLGERAELTILPDSGQLVLYRHPEEVIAALLRLRARGTGG